MILDEPSRVDKSTGRWILAFEPSADGPRLFEALRRGARAHQNGAGHRGDAERSQVLDGPVDPGESERRGCRRAGKQRFLPCGSGWPKH